MAQENEKIEASPEKLASEAQLDRIIPDSISEPLSDEQDAENIEALRAVDALGGLLLLVPMSCSVFKLNNTAAVWTNERCQNLAGVMVPVLRKYPFGQKLLSFIETGAGVEEIALMTILAPVVVQTYSAYQLDVKAREDKAAAAAKEVQSEQPSSNE